MKSISQYGFLTTGILFDELIIDVCKNSLCLLNLSASKDNEISSLLFSILKGKHNSPSN